MGTHSLRRAVIAGTTTLGLSGLSMLAPLAAHAEDVYGGVSQPAAAAAFLATELAAGGDHLSTTFDGETYYPDQGLTIDAVLALDAAGVAQDQAAASTDWLAANIGGYVGADGEVYANATAKALLFAVVRDAGPTSFGGIDLVARIQATEGTQEPGRYSDISEWGDYSNNIGQSFAILGLTRAGVGASDEAVDYLRAQQCADGGFQLQPTAGECASDPDVTSFAVQALIAASSTNDTDVVEALDYLGARQNDDGALGGGLTTEGVNANSTGLAASAFIAGNRTAQAAAATDFLTSLQHTCTTGPVELTGVISYDAAGFAAAQADGAVDQDRRATAQALIGLAGESLLTVSAGGSAATPALSCTAPSTSPSPTTTTQPATGGDDGGSTPTAPASDAGTPAVSDAGTPAVSDAGTPASSAPPTSGPGQGTAPAAPAAASSSSAVPATQAGGPRAGDLAATGADATFLLPLGIGLLVGGGALLAATRRSRSAA